MADDLANHFRLAKIAPEIALVLFNVLKTDFAFGLAEASLQILKGEQGMPLMRIAGNEVSLYFEDAFWNKGSD